MHAECLMEYFPQVRPIAHWISLISSHIDTRRYILVDFINNKTQSNYEIYFPVISIAPYLFALSVHLFEVFYKFEAGNEFSVLSPLSRCFPRFILKNLSILGLPV